MSQLAQASSIAAARKTWQYRFLESSLGITSIGFLIAYLFVAIFFPAAAAIFIIVYSFLWILKLGLNVIYTIHTYQNLRRWQKVDIVELFDSFTNGQTPQILTQIKGRYPNRPHWQAKLKNDIEMLPSIVGTKFSNPGSIVQVCIFSVYNEPAEVLIKSLLELKNSRYDLSKLLIFISQEARAGADNNQSFRQTLKSQSWLQFNDLITPKKTSKTKTKFCIDKLNLFIVEHPDGLVGEIKGKASNEDWGARQAWKLIQENQIDPELVIVTSLDADSHINQYFFHHLAIRFCLTPDRHQVGFQPIHIYSNNYFETGLWPRQIATQTSFFVLANLTTEDEMSFFAIYSVPLTVLIAADFWEKEVIAEDSVCFVKCLAHFNGEFRTVPFYGTFEGDAVEAEDYLQAIINQYKQLQRWAWGGIETFPYLVKKLFWEANSNRIDSRIKLKWIYLVFSNHFFWATTPLVFVLGPLLPIFIDNLLYDGSFQSSPISQNLSILATYFSWVSLIFMFAFGYLTFRFVAIKAARTPRLNLSQILAVLVQIVLAPVIYVLICIPALDAQIRGLFGQYLGYWVTPKK